MIDFPLGIDKQRTNYETGTARSESSHPCSATIYCVFAASFRRCHWLENKPWRLDEVFWVLFYITWPMPQLENSVTNLRDIFWWMTVSFSAKKKKKYFCWCDKWIFNQFGAKRSAPESYVALFIFIATRVDGLTDFFFFYMYWF